MNQIILQSKPRQTSIAPALVTTVLIILFLGFIDEGYYNFSWMKDIGNWIVFGLYALVIFPLIWVFSHFVFGKMQGMAHWAATIGVGVILTLLAVFFVFS